MSVYQVPLEQVPNQLVSTTIEGITWYVTVEKRLEHLYISLKTGGEDKILNRVCLDRNTVGEGFVFVDLEGRTDPQYETLGTRHILLWTDEPYTVKSTGTANPVEAVVTAPFNLSNNRNLITWDANQPYDYMNYYRSTRPFNLGSLPKPIFRTMDKSYIDNDIAENTTTYIMISTVYRGSERFSAPLTVFLANVFLSDINVTEVDVAGKTAPKANMLVEVLNLVSARMQYNGSRIIGVAQPNATITIEVED